MVDICFIHNITLHIPLSIISTIKCYSQGDSDFEAGGIILGKKLLDFEEYTITELTHPSNLDIRSRFGFIRNKRAAQRIINERWMRTKGVINYLGEWHTHPFSSPMPSMTDQMLLSIIAREKSNVFKYYFMLILGNTGKLFVGVTSSSSKGKIIDYKIIEV